MRILSAWRIYALLKWCFFISLAIVTTILITSSGSNEPKIIFEEMTLTMHTPLTFPKENWRNFSKQQINNLSTLGRYLFLDETPPQITDKDKIYKILTWKVGKFLERRHIYHFTKSRYDPFEKCSVRNCEITYDENQLPNADAVLIHMQRLKGKDDLPQEKTPRPANQRWIFLTDETPLFTFLNSRVNITEFNGKFNWTMTYRFESDVPVPYGRTVPKVSKAQENTKQNEIEESTFQKRSDVLVAVMGSNCGSKNHRWEYVRELQKYITVHFYGKCGTFQCPGHFSKDCDSIGNYKFYLSFENSNCAQYITEKLWWNAYAKNSIPIVMGASKSDYQQLLPPYSYINIDDYARPIDLARYISYVNKTPDVYQSYFEWKNYYQISNEHGYFQTDSYHYCRLCEALNYNDKAKKVYNTLEQFWTKNDCYARWDEGN